MAVEVAVWLLAVGLVSAQPPLIQWMYEEGTSDPRHWCQLSPFFKTCCSGKFQSPIALITSQTTWFSGKGNPWKSNFDIGPVKLTALNTGHTAAFYPPIGKYSFTGGCMPKGERYILQNFHFHWGGASFSGSEHTVDGMRHPIEMHMVHQDEKNEKMAVVAVLFQLSTTASAVDDLVMHLNDIHYKDKTSNFSFADIRSLLPAARDEYFCYQGSLTTPPCTEPVYWTVMKHQATITYESLQRFEDLAQARDDDPKKTAYIVQNYRPAQKLNGRPLYGIKDGGPRSRNRATSVYLTNDIFVKICFSLIFGYVCVPFR